MHVEVTPATAALRYPPAALNAALQTPATALLAATIAAEQLASSAFVDGTAAVVAAGGPFPADVLAYASGQQTNATLSEARLSRVMFIIRRLSSSQGLLLPMGDKIGAVTEAAARLMDTSYGEAERVLQTGDDVLRTLSAAIGGSLYSSSEGPTVTHRALVEVRETLGRSTALALHALLPSTDPHPLGPSTLRSLLYNGDISSPLWSTWSFADDTNTPAGRRRLLKVPDNLGSSSINSREGNASVTLDDFVAPGCGSASDAPDCLPHQVAIGMTYVADSSYVNLGLGDEEFRRAAVEWGWPLLEQDVVHTVSGVLSVAGTSGALLVPLLVVQLPLDMQMGMSDLREDNKFCARIDYDEMRLVFLGLVEVITSVQQYPGGWAVEIHNGACWADMYGDYVLVQVSRAPSSATAARGFVSPRTDHLRAADLRLVDPPSPSTAISSKSLQKIFLAAGVIFVGSLATVAGVIENCRHSGSRRPRGRPATKQKSRRVTTASVTSPGSDSDTVWAVDTDLRHSLRTMPTPEHWESDGDDSSRSDGADRRHSNGDTRYRRLLTLRNSGEGSQPWLPPEPLHLPVHAAVLCGGPHDLEAAVSDAEDINAKDSHGRTALHLAASVGRLDATRMLLRVVDVLPNMTDTLGHTPLHLAAAYGHVSIVHELLGTKSTGAWVMNMDTLEHGVHAQAASGSNAKPHLGAAGMQDAEGCTPLHVAAHFGQVEVASVLMRAGGDAALARHDVRGNTPLHHAAMRGKTETLLVMLRHCLRDDERAEWPMLKNADGHVAVDLATVHGYEETVEALLLWGQQFGVNVTRPHGEGVSLMTLATFHGKRAVSRVIRRNNWWMWEAAPEEVVLDGDALLREQYHRSLSAGTGAAAELFASQARRLVLHTSGRFNEVKNDIRVLVRNFSAKCQSSTGHFEPYREPSTGQPDFPDEITPAGEGGPETTRLVSGQH
jgi:hypothetical protein